MKWPWISRKKHEQECAWLGKTSEHWRQLNSINSQLLAETKDILNKYRNLVRSEVRLDHTGPRMCMTLVIPEALFLLRHPDSEHFPELCDFIRWSLINFYAKDSLGAKNKGH